MKRVVWVGALALALGGCAEIQKIQDAQKIATASVENPVTPDDLAKAEAGVTVVVSGLVGYRRLCLAKPRVIPKTCRTVIESIQPFTKQAEAQLPPLRKFVKENDQVNAVKVFNLIAGAVANAKDIAAKNNVPMPEVQ